MDNLLETCLQWTCESKSNLCINITMHTINFWMVGKVYHWVVCYLNSNQGRKNERRMRPKKSTKIALSILLLLLHHHLDLECLNQEVTFLCLQSIGNKLYSNLSSNEVKQEKLYCSCSVPVQLPYSCCNLIRPIFETLDWINCNQSYFFNEKTMNSK